MGIYYSGTWSLGDYKQSIARLLRPGQERKTLFIHILAEDTVDEDVYRALQSKADVVEAVLERMKG